jgi:hypothetical protein
MPQITLKAAILEIAKLQENANVPIIDVLRPWMAITGLTFKDALHLTHQDAVEGLLRVHAKLAEVLDVLDEDQIQEAACRCLKDVTVYGEMITDGEVAVRQGQNISWDGSSWNYVVDPKMRQRGSSKSYATALGAVRELLGA